MGSDINNKHKLKHTQSDPTIRLGIFHLRHRSHSGGIILSFFLFFFLPCFVFAVDENTITPVNEQSQISSGCIGGQSAESMIDEACG